MGMHEHYLSKATTSTEQARAPGGQEKHAGVDALSLLPAHASRALPEHLIALDEEGNWALWRWSALRSAGFPVERMLSLATPSFAAAIDYFLRSETTAARLQEALQPMLSAGDQQKEHELQSMQKELKAAREAKEVAWINVEEQFAPTCARLYQTLYEVACDERFREAVTWQNRQAVHNGLDAYRRRVERVSSARLLTKDREHALLIVKYLQRYCAKNDTIGFFGPAGWARWSSTGKTRLDVRAGQPLLAGRTVYFETWAIDALGEVLAQNPEALPFAVPRPMPFLHLEGDMLHIPLARPAQLSREQALVFAACDGVRTAKEVAQSCAMQQTAKPLAEAEVFAILHHLRSLRRIHWGFEVSMEEMYPERILRGQIARIEPARVRAQSLALLDQLEQARAAVARASDNADELYSALASLETTFVELTAMTATRDAGKVYAARTLVYEDCRRNIEITPGPALLDDVKRPLALLLKSARWFTYAAAELYRAAFRDAYTKLVQAHGSTDVDFATFWSWVQHFISVEPAERLINGLALELRQRWASILQVVPGARRVYYTSEQLCQQVQKVFDAPHPGWRSACYHSPDLMIDATDLDALQRGDYQFVLGEFHLGLNTLDVMALVSQHPDIAQLQEATRADFPVPRVVPVFPRHVLPAKRTHAMLALPEDWRFVFGVDSAGVPRERLLRTGDLVISDVAGTLIARTRDGRLQCELLEIFDGLCSLQACDNFKMLMPAAHTPRVTIDRLVVSRESWYFNASALSFAFCKGPLKSYLEARRWALQHELPRFLFFRTPLERKPYYLDLASPLCVEMFVRSIRRVQASALHDAQIVVSEMLPDPVHAWLPDAEGNRYTCEIRLAAVDQMKKTEGIMLQ